MRSKPIILLALLLAVFGVASVAGGFTTSPAALITARAVMGLGAAMSSAYRFGVPSRNATGQPHGRRADQPAGRAVLLPGSRIDCRPAMVSVTC